MNYIYILLSIIIILIILILFVYLFYSNRVTPPTAIITNFGITLSTTNVNNPAAAQYITLEAVSSSANIIPVPILALQTIPQNDFPTSAQGWTLWDIAANQPIVFIGSKTDPGFVATPPNTKIALLNNFNNGYVNFTTNGTTITGSLVALDISPPSLTSQNVFILEYDVNNPRVIQLKSVLPQIKGQDQYLIPGDTVSNGFGNNIVRCTIGVPSSNNQKWAINS